MLVPIKLKFDGVPNEDGSDTVHFPKLNQGAPYEFSLRIRLPDESYLEFDAPDIRWRMKLAPADKNELFELLKSEGNFEVDDDTDTLTFKMSAADWEDIKLPLSPNHMEMDVPFAFVIEFLDGAGVVTDRFAQGSGFITVSLLDI